MEAINPNPSSGNTKIETCESCKQEIPMSFFPANRFMPEPMILSQLQNGKCDDCLKKEWQAARASDILPLDFDRTNPDDLGGLKPFREFTLERFDRLSQSKLMDVAEAFDPAKNNLYLYGPCGTGKTHVATGIAHREAIKGQRVKVILMPDLMRSFRGLEAREEEELISAFAAKPVLVIDDLGVGKGTEFVMQIVFEILTKRDNAYRNGLIITSNLSLNELAAKMETDRLSSRISGMCKVVKIIGKDWRLER